MSSRSRTPPPAPPNSPVAGVRGIGHRSNERGQQGTRPNVGGDGPWVVPRQSRQSRPGRGSNIQPDRRGRGEGNR